MNTYVIQYKTERSTDWGGAGRFLAPSAAAAIAMFFRSTPLGGLYADLVAVQAVQVRGE